MATFAQAVQFLESFIDYERHRGRMKYNTRTLHIRRFGRFLRDIGSPHLAAPVVHLAGTKGKGSTAAILHSIAVEAGLRCGLYTSPHLESYCERIQIDRQPISKGRFARAADSLKRRLEKRGHELEPGYRTTFELLTTMALEVFRDEGVDLTILETGLGGRLDATNAVPSDLAVITAIGLDHTHLLGSTHERIAREKAGIIKPGRPVVVGRQGPGRVRRVLAVIRKVADRRGSRLTYAPRLVRVVSNCASPRGQRVCARIAGAGTELEVDLPLPGRHQVDNLQTALATVEMLRRRGWDIPDEAVVGGVARTVWPGRIELIGGCPPLVLDGAHCPLSVEALARTLEDRYPGREPVFVFSMLDDKPVVPTIQPMIRRFPGCRWVVFQAPSVRGCAVDRLDKALRDVGMVPASARNPSGALRKARGLAGPSGLIVAFGSLYSEAPLRKAHQRLLTRAAPAT